MTSGTVVGGKYRLLRLIGEGAMGQVWAAVNELTGGEVALKLLPRPREDSRRRLLREARACGKLRHRNIIDVHDIGETDEGEPFLVMSLLSGETLGDLLERKRRLEPPHAAQIARDVARALAAAHRAGFVHRDLKPANIFLHREEGEDGVVVKVLDFGVVKDLARADGLATVAGLTVGSPAYMSPEQALASPDLDARADLWALGVVLFEMLTGKRPFDGDSHQVIMKIIRAPVPSVTQLVRGAPAGLADVVARCLQRDPKQRFASASELVEALDRFTRPAAGEASVDAGPRSGSASRDATPSPSVAAITTGPRSAPGTTGPRIPTPVAPRASAPMSALETLRVPSPLPPRGRTGPAPSSIAPLVRESHAPLVPAEPLHDTPAPPSAAVERPRRSLLLVAAVGVVVAALGLAVVHAIATPPPRAGASTPPPFLDPAPPSRAVVDEARAAPPAAVADAVVNPPLHKVPAETPAADREDASDTHSPPPAASPDTDPSATSRAPAKAQGAPHGIDPNSLPNSLPNSNPNPNRPRRPSFLPRVP